MFDFGNNFEQFLGRKGGQGDFSSFLELSDRVQKEGPHTVLVEDSFRRVMIACGLRHLNKNNSFQNRQRCNELNYEYRQLMKRRKLVFEIADMFGKQEAA